MSRNLISILSVGLMCGSSSARSPRVAAVFTMLFLLIVDSGAWAANGLPRHVIPISPLDQFAHRGFIGSEDSNIHGNMDFNVLPRMGRESSLQLIQIKMPDPPPAYFLLEQPTDLSLAILPADAQDVVVARVRLVDPPLYLAGEVVRGVSPLPSELYSVRLEILSVLRGKAPTEARQQLTFESRDKARLDTPTAVPSTPKQLAREYFAVIYSNSEGRHLAGFPMSKAAYREWHQEILEFDRERRNGEPPKR
jgi:hypothetical protein